MSLTEKYRAGLARTSSIRTFRRPEISRLVQHQITFSQRCLCLHPSVLRPEQLFESGYRTQAQLTRRVSSRMRMSQLRGMKSIQRTRIQLGIPKDPDLKLQGPN